MILRSHVVKVHVICTRRHGLEIDYRTHNTHVWHIGFWCAFRPLLASACRNQGQSLSARHNVGIARCTAMFRSIFVVACLLPLSLAHTRNLPYFNQWASSWFPRPTNEMMNARDDIFHFGEYQRSADVRAYVVCECVCVRVSSSLSN